VDPNLLKNIIKVTGAKHNLLQMAITAPGCYAKRSAVPNSTKEEKDDYTR
jgi:hypothetical protein